MNYEAIFCDETEDYRIPSEPTAGSIVTLRLRTGKDDAKSVRLMTHHWNHEMKKVASEGYFDYYETTMAVGEEPISYWFTISDDWDTVDFNRRGCSRSKADNALFHIFPHRHTPEWAKGAVMYQIFVDRFCDGDKTNNVVDGEYRYLKRNAVAVEDWNSMPESMDVHRFYGGDLQGVLDKLDYLQELGVEVLYLNPVFVSPSNHKYDTQDYDYIDPHYGVIVKDGNYATRVSDKENLEASNQFFIKFVEEVHRRGMRVIMDAVMNHCGSFHKWMNHEKIYKPEDGYSLGAYESAESPYHDYFRFEKDRWPDNDTYEGWWGHETLPKLNYEGSQELWKEVLRVGRKWVSAPYNVDGWRLDVAADLGHSAETNHKFWTDFREEVRKANPEAIVLAEHYDDPYPWIGRGEWDTVMNYAAFMEPLTWYLTGLEKHSDTYRGDMLCNAEAFWHAMHENIPSLGNGVHIAMNQLSNHDHSRFLTRTNRMAGRLGRMSSADASLGIRYSTIYQAVVMQMTWPGAPTLYYGDEAGVTGWTDPDNRRTYPWGSEDKGLIEFHKKAIAVHRSSEALRIGSLHKLYGKDAVVAFGRSKGQERIVTVVNASDTSRTVNLPVWKTGCAMNAIFENLLKTSPAGYDQLKDVHQANGGWLSLTLVGQSSIVLKECPHCEPKTTQKAEVPIAKEVDADMDIEVVAARDQEAAVSPVL